MSDCAHECEPYSRERIVVSDEEFYANPLRQDWSPPRIVPCIHCGYPCDRGHYGLMISIPALSREERTQEPEYNADARFEEACIAVECELEREDG